ncbi:MAG: ABC transporter substrate-binding protein [Candidatus Tectomicrobia bacterium]|uniref:ABC transporter substrate-binding protein n=1 Tax=Tectimicrobiota bacterium TaxID=2528274 RepID=A0A937W233_UNCTE|nr:ABC transporter substrate-binding protein [Candidatus Tectomicrobia bacterium]
MGVLRVMASRHSAFYSPLLGAIAGGFLQEEGFEPVYTPLPPGQNVAQLLAAGEIDVAQSAVSSSWAPLEQGQQPPTVHFAQINERDGFFIAARHPDPHFTWSKLRTGGLMFVHGGQPQAMLAYAMHKQGVDLAQVSAINAGSTANMLAQWRQGEGAYFHEQGPYPQQLVHEGVGHIVASVGEVIGPVAFSTLSATRAWLQKPEAVRFMRAYRKARAWVNKATAAEIAKAEQSLFPETNLSALTQTIAAYQQLGCWHPSVEISRETYDRALDVFLHSQLITKRHPYEQVVVPAPEG